MGEARSKALAWRRAATVSLSVAMLAIALGAPAVARAATPTTTTLDVPTGTQYGTFYVDIHVRPAPQVWMGYVPGVSIYVDGVQRAGGPLFDGDAHEPLTLSPGTHELVAVYVGNEEYGPSESAPASVVVGIATKTTLTWVPDSATNSTTVTIRATVAADTGDVTGGTLSITDAFDGATLAAGTLGGGTSSVAFTGKLAVGTHAITATYSGAGDLGPSDATLAHVVLKDSTVAVSGLGVQYSVFYPVTDGYRDTVAIRGKLAEPATVVITIKNSSGKVVRSANLGLRQTGSYAYTWNGRYSTGTLLPAGTYTVYQKITDTVGNSTQPRWSVVLSLKKLVWYSHTITKPGYQYYGYWKGGTAWLSTSRSSYSGGVRLSSGNAAVAVRYPFALRTATVYKTLYLKVLGRSPNGTYAWEGLWNRTWGGSTNLGSYEARKIGPSYKWYTYGFDPTTHRSGRTVYGVVAAVNDGAVRTFDIAKVQLSYRYALLK